MAASVLVLVLATAACALADLQSPIDLESDLAVTVTDLPPLRFKHYSSSQSTYYLANSGHGAQITISNWLHRPRISGGPLEGSYVLEQVHFHWGDDDGVGSEHYMDGSPFSMEVHFVHWNKKYDSYEVAAEQPDGLAVVAFFIECGDCSILSPAKRQLLCRSLRRRLRKGRPGRHVLQWLCRAGQVMRRRLDSVMTRYLPSSVNARIRSNLFPRGLDNYRNTEFQKLVNLIPQIKDKTNAKVKADTDLLTWALPNLESGGYFTYAGSLTTKPFSENVRWIVYDNPIVIGKKQIAAFREIENAHREILLSNKRDLQQVDGREVDYVPLA